MPAGRSRAPAGAAWPPPGGCLLAAIDKRDYASFLGPPSPDRLAAFWALAQLATHGTLSLTMARSLPGVREVRARLSWRTVGGRKQSLITPGGGGTLQEAADHAVFFGLRRLLLGDAAVTGRLLTTDQVVVDLAATEPLAGLYELTITLATMAQRSGLSARGLDKPATARAQAVLVEPTGPVSRTRYMRVRWGPIGMPWFLRQERGRRLPARGALTLHRVVAVLRGEAVIGHHVHHRNHYGPDNRSENLLTLTPQAHAHGGHLPSGEVMRFHAAFVAPPLLPGVDSRLTCPGCPGGALCLEGAGCLRGGLRDGVPGGGSGLHSSRDGRCRPARVRLTPATKPSLDPHAASSLMAEMACRSDFLRRAEAVVHLLRLTARPWTPMELHALTSIPAGSLRRLMARLLAHQLVKRTGTGRAVRYLADTNQGETSRAGMRQGLGGVDGRETAPRRHHSEAEPDATVSEATGASRNVSKL
jgi:hypothetical protein